MSHNKEDDGINNYVGRAITDCTTSNDHKTLAECVSSNDVSTQSEVLETSEFYATAVESFDVHSVVLATPQDNVSKKNPAKMWRKRKRCSDDDLFMISKKKLKINSDKILKIGGKNKGNNKGFATFIYCSVVMKPINVFF